MKAPITRLLHQAREGDARALEELLPIVYEELRRMAGGLMRGERPGHTLQPTALVHEFYAKLVDRDLDLEDRGHFFSLAARAMRRILVDHARTKGRAKRGGRPQPVTLEAAMLVGDAPSEALIDIDEALRELEQMHARQCHVAELHYFAGATHEEIAGYLGLSTKTIQRDLKLATAWIRSRLAD